MISRNCFFTFFRYQLRTKYEKNKNMRKKHHATGCPSNSASQNAEDFLLKWTLTWNNGDTLRRTSNMKRWTTRNITGWRLESCCWVPGFQVTIANLVVFSADSGHLTYWSPKDTRATYFESSCGSMEEWITVSTDLNISRFKLVGKILKMFKACYV